MKILVTDGENRAALAATRSLGRRGDLIFVTGKMEGNLAASSRFCHRSFVMPDPLTHPVEYCEEVISIISRERIDVVLPITEQSIYILNRVRHSLPPDVVLASANAEMMESVSNKYEVFKKAKMLGIPIPKTIFVEPGRNLAELNLSDLTFPVVIKPAFSKILAEGRILSSRVMYVSNIDELKRLYKQEEVLAFPSMIQEVIIGEGTGLFSLFDGSRHLLLFSHRRLLEKPPSGGVSVLSESVALDPEMVDAAARLLAEAGWKGVAMVEFKRDVADGRAKLMEINGRLWGSLQLAISSGVDFPAYYIDYYTGRMPQSVCHDYRIGLRLKWFFGIVDHLYIRLKQITNRPSIIAGPYSLPRALLEIFSFNFGNRTSDVLDLADIKPFFREAFNYFKKETAKR